MLADLLAQRGGAGLGRVHRLLRGVHGLLHDLDEPGDALRGNDMLRSVKRPDGEMVSFEYDPLGRRISKTYKEKTTRWVWDYSDRKSVV